MAALIRSFDLRSYVRRRDVQRFWAAFALAAVILTLTITDAKRRGMDHAVMISPGEQIAISIAISETVYRLRLGYIGFTSVLNTLQGHWNKDADGWNKLDALIRNFHDKHLLNAGIAAASSLGPQKVGYLTDGSLITTIYDDMGEVDYYKIAFGLFGRKIGSAFILYFVLLGATALAFIVTFRDNVYALAVLLCTLFAFYVELYLAVFDKVGNPTYFGMRHSSTLGLVPTLYFAFLLVYPRKPTPGLIAGALLQLAVLILAWRIRGSVTWMFLFLFVLAAVLAVVRSWPAQVHGGRLQSALARSSLAVVNSWPLVLRAALRWPVVLLLLGMAANAVYNQQSRHLIYSTDDVIPYHGLWWTGVNALYDKQPGVFSPRAKNTGGTPEGWWHLRDYYDRMRLVPWAGAYTVGDPIPGLASPWTRGELKYRLVDETMKRIYLEAVKKRPLVSARFYLIEQPAHMTNQLKLAFTSAKSNTWLWLVLASGAVLFAFVRLLDDETDSVLPGQVMLLGVAVFLGSVIPALWAHAHWPTMPDTILLAVALMSLALGLGANRLFRRTHARLESASKMPAE